MNILLFTKKKYEVLEYVPLFSIVILLNIVVSISLLFGSFCFAIPL
jgi:hypothetical protein